MVVFDVYCFTWSPLGFVLVLSIAGTRQFLFLKLNVSVFKAKLKKTLREQTAWGSLKSIRDRWLQAKEPWERSIKNKVRRSFASPTRTLWKIPIALLPPAAIAAFTSQWEDAVDTVNSWTCRCEAAGQLARWRFHPLLLLGKHWKDWDFGIKKCLAFRKHFL